jgi:hypothetical protein
MHHVIPTHPQLLTPEQSCDQNRPIGSSPIAICLQGSSQYLYRNLEHVNMGPGGGWSSSSGLVVEDNLKTETSDTEDRDQ